MHQSISKTLSQPAQSLGLAIFRIFFGLILLWDVVRIIRIELIESFYPRGIIFPYTFINLPLVSEFCFNMFVGLMLCTCILIICGVFFRMAMIVFTVFLAYIFFLDQTLYNNHLYLIIIFGLILAFLPADAALTFNKKKRKQLIPIWSYMILKFQLVVVYFYGGLAKLNVFWLSGHPGKEIIKGKFDSLDDSSILFSAMIFLITYGGIFFDLFIGFLLLKRSTRLFALPLAIMFNVFNAYIFDDIYIFPFFMIAALILFLDQDQLAARIIKNQSNSESYNFKKMELNSKRILPFLLIFMFWQLLMPLRHYFVDGYTDWTGDYQQFSWRMKIQHRTLNTFDLSLLDDDSKLRYPINYKEHLYSDEISNMINRPQMMLQFVKYIEKRVVERNNLQNYKIVGNINVDFNGKEKLTVFDPDLDLAKLSLNDMMSKWVIPIDVE